MKSFFKSIYLGKNFFISYIAVILLFVLANFIEDLYAIAQYSLAAITALVIYDTVRLYSIKTGIEAERFTPLKFSNGDRNKVNLVVKNKYPKNLNATLIDELPFQLQKRDTEYKHKLDKDSWKTISYSVTPYKRGDYNFGAINIFIETDLGLIKRRYYIEAERNVPVYPSIIQMRYYELFTVNNRFAELGIKKKRRVGHSLEFDQIRNYVQGDDLRTINWKATARKSSLMVNSYMEEKSQNVYNVVDTGRVMKNPFDGLTLMDYAVNTSLVISNTALRRGDKAGLITFSKDIESIVPAERNYAHLNKIIEVLYKQSYNYFETDYEKLYGTLITKITNRSLVIIYTNFETFSALEKQIKFLLRLSKKHLILLVFYENTELNKLLASKAKKIEDVFNQAAAENLYFEKFKMINELKSYGINFLYTSPENLTLNTINKYLELKTRDYI